MVEIGVVEWSVFVEVHVVGVVDGRSKELLLACSWGRARKMWVVDLDSIRCSLGCLWNGSGGVSFLVLYHMGSVRSWHSCVDGQVFGGNIGNMSRLCIGIGWGPLWEYECSDLEAICVR